MLHKRVILFFVSVATILALYQVPIYKTWIIKRIIFPDDNGNLFSQVHHLDEEQRKEMRYGHSYIFYKGLVQQFNENGIFNVFLLLPPNEYLRVMKVKEIAIPEPSVFYYYTGINSVNSNSPDVKLANWALAVIDTGNVMMTRIKSPEQLDAYLKLYKNYQN
jgi:hypothetical protein